MPPPIINVGITAGAMGSNSTALISTGDNVNDEVMGATLPMLGVPKAMGVNDKL